MALAGINSCRGRVAPCSLNLFVFLQKSGHPNGGLIANVARCCLTVNMHEIVEQPFSMFCYKINSSGKNISEDLNGEKTNSFKSTCLILQRK